jgi:hypothetical protein
MAPACGREGDPAYDIKESNAAMFTRVIQLGGLHDLFYVFLFHTLARIGHRKLDHPGGFIQLYRNGDPSALFEVMKAVGNGILNEGLQN